MHYENSFAIPTHPSRAYKIISDPTNIPKYNPDIENVAITKMTPGLVGTEMKLFTKSSKEIFGTVVQAAAGRSCTFRTETGRLIHWDIETNGTVTSLKGTIDTEDDVDEATYRPQVERAFRILRSDLKRR